MKGKFKTYAFWVSLSGAVVILLQSLGKIFGFEIESETVENVIMSVCGILVVLGIVSNPVTTEVNSTANIIEEVVEPTKEELPIVEESQNIMEQILSVLTDISEKLNTTDKTQEDIQQLSEPEIVEEHNPSRRELLEAHQNQTINAIIVE